MSTPKETFPVELLGGPLDGTRIDLTKRVREIRRLSEGGGNLTRYVRKNEKQFVFHGYALGDTKEAELT